MRCAWVVLGLAGCGFTAGVTGDAGAIDAAVDAVDAAPDATRPDGAVGAARKKLVTIDPAKVTADLTSFPVWFRLNGDADLIAHASPSGSDLYFTLPNGTPLEFELVRWKPSTGDLDAFVRMDVSDVNPTTFELRYGDPGAAHAPNPLQTWSNAFTAVWHMDDALGGSTTVADALGQRMGTAVNGPTSAAGKLGRGIAFDGTNDRVTFTNPISGNQPSTISAWVDVVAPTTGFSCVLSVGNAAGNQARFIHTNYPNLAIGLYGSDLQPGNTNIAGLGPTLVHWVYAPNGNAGKTTLYANGAEVATMNHPGGVNTSGTAGFLGYAPQPFGPGGNTENPLHGTLDEVRIANVARSKEWIETESANQSSPGSFYSVGTEQIIP